MMAECFFLECDRRASSHGLCGTHARQRARGKDLTPIRRKRSAREPAIRDDAGRKLCIDCSTWRIVSDFGPSSTTSDGLHPFCRSCLRDRARWSKYGLSVAASTAMLAAQGGACRICGDQLDEGYAVDHDHSCCSGQRSCGDCIRGLLCASCNSGLGFFRDDPTRLINAALYLETAQIGAVV